MNCHRAGELLSLYLEGELAPARAAALEAHLSGCDRCRAELADVRRAIDVLRTPPTLVTPVGLLAEFKSRLETAPRRPFPFFRPPVLWLAPAGAVAAALLVGVVIYEARMPGSGPAAEHARVARTASPRLAYAPPASSARGLMREKDTGRSRPEKSDQPTVDPFETKERKEDSQIAGNRAPSGRTRAGEPAADGVDRMSTPGSPLARRPMRVGELQGGAGSGVGGRVAPQTGAAGRPAGAALPSRDQFAPRDRPVSTPSPVASQPPPPPFPSRRADEARERESRPRLLLPPGVERPKSATDRRSMASARPAPAPPGLSGRPSGAGAPSAPPPALSEEARRREPEIPATGRAWVAVRYVTPAQPPAGAGPASDAGQQLRAAATPQATGETAATAGARRAAKIARPSLALAGVTPALVALMRRPVRVSVADVPLADLLRQIGASAGAPLSLDPKVPDTMRCHAQLLDVPLYEALQKVAEATGMVIAPQGTVVTLRPRGGDPVNAHSPFWSRDWGTAPETQFATPGGEEEKRR